MSRFLPPKSYIDANSFKTTKDLADYLKFLSASPVEYAKYFWWRRHYKIYKNYINDFSSVCKIVSHWIESGQKKTYKNIKQWFGEGCSQPKIKF
jgi:alpha-1,3-fucosyltransferase